MLSGNLGTTHWPELPTARGREEGTIRNPRGPPSQACFILPGRGGTRPPSVHSPGSWCRLSLGRVKGKFPSSSEASTTHKIPPWGEMTFGVSVP